MARGRLVLQWLALAIIVCGLDSNVDVGSIMRRKLDHAGSISRHRSNQSQEARGQALDLEVGADGVVAGSFNFRADAAGFGDLWDPPENPEGGLASGDEEPGGNLVQRETSIIAHAANARRITYTLVKPSVVCTAPDTSMAYQDSLTNCSNKVHEYGGKFFIYGTGVKEGYCYWERTALKTCPEGFETDNYNFYELLPVKSASGPADTAVLLKSAAECKSNDQWLGIKSSVDECAATVRTLGGKFFKYGLGHKDKFCQWEKTSSGSCPEGYEGDAYNFYEIKPIQTLVRSNAACLSADVTMGEQPSVDACAAKVKAAGGTFFIYGTGEKAKQCAWEKTVSKYCPETWEIDTFNFYELTPPILANGPADKAMMVKGGMQCKSANETDLGNSSSVNACAEKVNANGGLFFIYGIGPNAGKCIQEKSSSGVCSEGWESDAYNFYLSLYGIR